MLFNLRHTHTCIHVYTATHAYTHAQLHTDAHAHKDTDTLSCIVPSTEALCMGSQLHFVVPDDGLGVSLQGVVNFFTFQCHQLLIVASNTHSSTYTTKQDHNIINLCYSIKCYKMYVSNTKSYYY